jgi:uncharacterized membrane protein
MRLPDQLDTGRLEAFSDAVIAIIITIMVLEIHPPHGHDFEAWTNSISQLVAYILSFIFLGIYWNNHHHLFKSVKTIGGGVMWANLHLLFWLSLVPVVTSWIGEDKNYLDKAPVIAYGVVAFMSAAAYAILVRTLQHRNPNQKVVTNIGRDRKGIASNVLYALGIAFALLNLPLLGIATYVAVSIMWLIPDRRLYR